MSRFIEVVDYREDWLSRYQSEASSLHEVFNDALVRIHHIGSTCIPGMKAKPVIDILVEVEPKTVVSCFNSQMSNLGYDCRGECLDAVIPGTPGRYYFSKDVEGVRSFHVHVCRVGHSQIFEFLTLRDYLKSHRVEAEKYGNLKRQLALQFPDDNIEYMRGKDRLVKELIACALKWRESV